mgnify:FL=1
MSLPMNLKKISIAIYVLSLPVLFFQQEKENRESVLTAVNPLRIVSLSPSITRQIADLGAGNLLVGITEGALRPELKSESVGSYMSPNLEKIISLRPDLVIISEEDAYIQKAPLLKQFGLRVVELGKNSDFESMCANYKKLAAMIGQGETAEEKLAEYRARLERIVKPAEPPGIVFLVSVKPLITVSEGAHVSSIISDAGGVNVFSKAKTAYPILSLESLLLSRADAIIVMNREDVDHLYVLIRGFSNTDFAMNNNIFTTGDEIIPYYTPHDYTVSVEKIASIIGRIKR